MKYKIGIAGAAGYTGGELLRILLNHPESELVFAHSRSQNGQPLSSIHQDLEGETDLLFTNRISESVDFLFLCTGHGESRKFLETNPIPDSVKIIDLSNDFRLASSATFQNRMFTYGLPELNIESIRTAKNIANPGCFATAIQLALLPLLSIEQVKEAYTTGITGSTGAGQALSSSSHFSWRNNNIQAYKTLTHQHLSEIGQSIKQVSGSDLALHFVPWRGDFSRGIFTSTTVKSNLPYTEVVKVYEDFYSKSPFVHISHKPIHLKQVVNTNKCLIQIEHSDGIYVIHSIIDNLIKGASGQAVQNMNLMAGLNETTGLQLKSTAY